MDNLVDRLLETANDLEDAEGTYYGGRSLLGTTIKLLREAAGEIEGDNDE